eukprot:Ihof_evm3s327 gene=Ihof_evmTU3s327
MAAPTELATIYSELEQHLKNEKYDAGSRIAAKLLQENPMDVHAYQAKIICLINLNQFEASLKLIDSHKGLETDIAFPKAYVLYRLHRLDDALTILKSQTKNEPRLKELEAQILYRMEDFSAALEIYEKMLPNVKDNGEHMANYLAALAGTKSIGLDTANVPGELQTHEQYYNAACYYIAVGDLKQAEASLEKGMDVCRKSLQKEGFDAQEVEDELSVLKVQLGVIYQLTGRGSKAKEIYDYELKMAGDSTVIAVANNNNCVLRAENNDLSAEKGKRLLKDATIFNKLTSSQKKTISLNQALLFFHTRQFDHCRQELKLLSKEGKWDMLVLVKAACWMHEKKYSQAIGALEEFLNKNPTGDNSKIHLALAQLAINQGRVDGASKWMSLAATTNPTPELVLTMTTRAVQLGEMELAERVFTEAISFHEKTNNNEALTKVLTGYGEFLETNKNYKEAATVYERLIKMNPRDTSGLARLVLLYAKVDPDKVELYADQLPSIDAQIAAIDINALEAENAHFKKLTVKKSDLVLKTPDDKQKKKRYRKRKGKLPKDVNCVLDPERWLPKYQRSYYRKRNKGRMAIRGPQGAAASTSPSTTGSTGNRAGSGANTSAGHDTAL